ncbi:MAG: hypothetical protein ABIO21_22775 [Pseudomonas sp.]
MLDLFRREGVQPNIDGDGFDMKEIDMSFYVSDADKGESAIVKAIYVGCCSNGR